MLALPVGLYFVVCDWSSAAPSKCAYDHILALPFGSIRSVAATGTIILVAPLRGGLFALDTSTDTCAPCLAASTSRDTFQPPLAAHSSVTLFAASQPSPLAIPTPAL